MSGKAASILTSDIANPTPVAPVVNNALVIHLFLGKESGGITSALGQWIPVQKQWGWRHLAYSLTPGPITDEMARFGIDMAVANRGLGLSKLQRFTTARLRAEFENLGPVIIHTHNPAAQFYTAWNTKKHDPWKIVRTVHADTSLEMKHNLSWAGRFFWKQAAAWSMKRTPGIICIHEHVRASLDRSLQSRVEVIPNGLNPELIENSKANLPEDLAHWLNNSDDRTTASASSISLSQRVTEKHPPMVLAIGRFVHIKRYDWLIKSWAASAARKFARLVILGDGPLKDNLNKLIYELGVDDSVRLQSWTADIAPVLKRASLTVVTSRSETGPLVLLESMAANVATIATPVGVVPDVIEHEISGWILNHPQQKPNEDNVSVSKGVNDELTTVLNKLLMDPDLLSNMGDAAKKRLSITHSHIDAAKSRAIFYNNILSSK